jgi:hypothetical protein
MTYKLGNWVQVRPCYQLPAVQAFDLRPKKVIATFNNLLQCEDIEGTRYCHALETVEHVPQSISDALYRFYR